MKLPKCVAALGPRKRRSLCCNPIPILTLLCAAALIARASFVMHSKEKSSALNVLLRTESKECEVLCKPSGTQALPKGIVSSTSDLQMRPLWGSPTEKKSDMSLLAMAVGQKQKENVDRIVRKFLVSDFVVMLFHYDGNVDDWKDYEWSADALHVAAANQTKWWFAKRFLHPDIVAEYSYIFIWDEDLGVEHFNVESYISVIQREGLEISQPAIDATKSEIHHMLTARRFGVKMHRRTYYGGNGRRGCDENSTGPPCTGWVEMMAPVFSKAAWRCTWYLIQNDLVHAWGMDFLFGYCAQGDRTENVGIVDSDYVIHFGLPTLGGEEKAALRSEKLQGRQAVRRQSYKDLAIFKNRWKKAVEDDDSWTDPFAHPKKPGSW